MSKRFELNADETNKIVGGSIDYYPDYPGAATGTIGINQNPTHTYKNEQDIINYVIAHKDDKVWMSIKERDEYLFSGMIGAGLLTPISQ